MYQIFLSERVLLVGCGKERELDERQYRQIINKTINTLKRNGFNGSGMLSYLSYTLKAVILIGKFAKP